MKSTPDERVYVAVDLGASSGRVVAGTVRAGQLRTWELVRFANRAVPFPDGLHWNVIGFLGQILRGVSAAHRVAGSSPVSIGIDSWGVDYGLIDRDGALVGVPYSYRDRRTPSGRGELDEADVYRITGVPTLPINTSMQLLAALGTAALDAAQTLLLIPDLLGYLLTGEIGAEVTNASTTQLLEASHLDWAWDLVDRLGLPRRLLPPLRRPGYLVGEMLPLLVEEARLERPVAVRTVASHDTASAVLTVPANDEYFAYVSCGTWALVGVELNHPVLSEESREAGFTNEAGVDGTVLFLHPVVGLWLLQEALRCWATDRQPLDPGRLLAAAGREDGLRSLIDPNDLAFVAPAHMVHAIQQQCVTHSQSVPSGPAAVVRCILDSLALAFALSIERAEQLSGHEIRVVHLVGGGAANRLLCQLTADACERPVVAGPKEASITGNLAVQAWADGHLATLHSARSLIGKCVASRTYSPAGDPLAWRDARRRLRGL